MAVSKKQAMRPAEIDLVDAVNKLEDSTSAFQQSTEENIKELETGKEDSVFIIYVNVDDDKNVESANKTYDEIIAAITAGNKIMALVNQRSFAKSATYYMWLQYRGLDDVLYFSVIGNSRGKYPDDYVLAVDKTDTWKFGTSKTIPNYTFSNGIAATSSDAINFTVQAKAANGSLTVNNDGIAIANPANNIFDDGGNAVGWSEGESTTASGYVSHAEGESTMAGGDYSHAEGNSTTADGYDSHAEGESTMAGGDGSHAEGYSTEANGNYSHAEGNITAADGDGSHAEGESTIADGNYSHAEGESTMASSLNQHVFGSYNVADTEGSNVERGAYVEIVGNGMANDSRSNARTLAWNGTQWTAGDVTCDAVQGNHDNLYSLREIGKIVASVPTMEYGTSNSVTVQAGSHTLVDVTFHGTKTEIPVVFPAIQCPTAGVNLIATVQSVTNSQASICITNLGTTNVDNVTVDYLAISGR